MKKKIALLLAAAMTLSLLPMNVFAASTNSLSRTNTVMPENTLMAEPGAQFSQSTALGAPGGRGTPSSPALAVGSMSVSADDIDYLIEAPYLKIEFKDTAVSGEEFKLTLENAKWFFKNNNSTDYAKASQYATVSRSGLTFKDVLEDTFNATTNTWDDTNRVYHVTAPAAATGLTSINYDLTVSATNNKVATVTLRQGATAGTHALMIPIVALTTAANDVKVRVDSNMAVSSGLYMVGSASGTTTTTTVTDPQSGRDEFEIKDHLVIRENRIGSVKNGWFEIKAPAGFEFPDNLLTMTHPSDHAKAGQLVVQLGLESGLAWGGDTSNAGSQFGQRNVPNADYAIRFKSDGYGNLDYSVLEVGLFNVVPSSTVAGAVYIEGLKLYADEGASMGPIYFSVKNINRAYGATDVQTWMRGLGSGSGDDVLTAQTNVLAATRVDWAVTFKPVTDIPTLVNGRYDSESPLSANDDYHKTARVQFAENAINSWWANRTTSFVLPEQVKFRKVEITTQDNIVDDQLTKAAVYEDIYLNTGRKENRVVIDGNVMTWQNLAVKANEKAKIEFDIWVSIESGYEGDVTLSAEAALSTSNGRITTDEDIATIVIAKAVNPITIETKVTDIKVGYQYQATADIIIKETAAGRLLKNKEMLISVSDMISSDMILYTDKQAEVVEGDLKYSNWSNLSGGYTTRASGSSLYGRNVSEGGAISFRITQQSSKTPATLKISNLSVKLDRGVPETNKKYYKAVVWGSAIAENFGSRTVSGARYYDTFDVPGISEDYIKVVSSADSSGLLNSEVAVTIGESYYTVNGITYDMDAAAYISPASNSTMVPIRFMAYALGLGEESVIWDGDNRTVTLLHPSRIIQFTIDSSTMLIAGAPVTMTSPDGKAVVAEIKNERSYIPFRAFGDAFGVPVTWKADTQTAVYNEGKSPTTLQ